MRDMTQSEFIGYSLATTIAMMGLGAMGCTHKYNNGKYDNAEHDSYTGYIVGAALFLSGCAIAAGTRYVTNGMSFFSSNQQNEEQESASNKQSQAKLA